MADWKQSLIEHMPHLPFILATRANGVAVTARMNTTRILESLIIAGITGGIVMYGVQSKLDVQMAELRLQMIEVKSRFNDERNEAIAREARVQARIDSVQSSVMSGMNGRPH